MRQALAATALTNTARKYGPSQQTYLPSQVSLRYSLQLSKLKTSVLTLGPPEHRIQLLLAAQDPATLKVAAVSLWLTAQCSQLLSALTHHKVPGAVLTLKPLCSSCRVWMTLTEHR